MKVFNLSLKQFIFVLLLTGVSAVSTYYVAKPYAYVGYLVALFLVLMAGLISDHLWGMASGLIGISAGLALLHNVPQEVGKKSIEAFESYRSWTASYFWLLILGGILLGFLGGMLAKWLRPAESESISVTESETGRIMKPAMSTRDLTIMAMFVAIGVAINSVRVGIFSFGGFPIILSGYVLGPIPGFIVGAVTDIVAFIVRPSAFPFNPVYTLTSALTGLIPVIITNLLGEKYPKYSFWKVLPGVVIGQFITSVFMVSLFNTILQASDKSFWVQYWIHAGKAAVKQAWSTPLYAFLVVSVIEALSKAVPINSRRKPKLYPSKEA